MKNTLLLIASLSTLALSACGNITTTTSTTNLSGALSSEFGIPSCDKYVKLMDCVISKIPVNQQTETKQQYNEAMTARKKLPADQLKQICDTTIAQLDSVKDTYKSMGCEL